MEETRCLLAVYAHPDDEAFSTAGTFRKYSDQGVKTALVCATRGEAGKIRDPALATPETLGQVRERELRDACRLLGVEDLSFLDYRDGTLPHVDEDEAERRIVYHIRRLRAQVVVTFDETGIYGHPDHIAVHKLTVSAFHKAGDPTWYPEHLHEGLLPYAPQKLYGNVIARSVLLQLQHAHMAGGVQALPGGDGAMMPVAQLGTPDEQITTRIFLDDYQFEMKMAAINAHKTQMDPQASFNRAPREKVRKRLGIETFKLLVPPLQYIMEEDLFEGVVV